MFCDQEAASILCGDSSEQRYVVEMLAVRSICSNTGGQHCCTNDELSLSEGVLHAS